MSQPALEIRDNPDQHRFEVQVSGQIAVAQYVLSDSVISFTHTEVPESLEGQGIGSALVEFALRDARSRNLKVAPMCPFVAAYIRRHRDFADLVPDEYRERISGNH